jgi:hypothetical protein
VEWVLVNDLGIPNQNIAYHNIKFDYDPGVRIGIEYNNTWYNKFYYTGYYTKAYGSTNGNLVSTFLGGKLATSGFYRSAQVNFRINFNTLDWDLGKKFYLAETVMLRPILGLRGGWINQQVVTNFQGPTSVTETVKNNFRGLGPKIGVASEIALYHTTPKKISIIADFSTSYLWGNWGISDVLTDNLANTFMINVGSRNFGAFTTQAILGAALEYKKLAFKLGYEIFDWFDQYQVLDDGTGAHQNDLVLQGLTLGVSYKF